MHVKYFTNLTSASGNSGKKKLSVTYKKIIFKILFGKCIDIEYVLGPVYMPL